MSTHVSCCAFSCARSFFSNTLSVFSSFASTSFCASLSCADFDARIASTSAALPKLRENASPPLLPPDTAAAPRPLLTPLGPPRCADDAPARPAAMVSRPRACAAAAAAAAAGPPAAAAAAAPRLAALDERAAMWESETGLAPVRWFLRGSSEFGSGGPASLALIGLEQLRLSSADRVFDLLVLRRLRDPAQFGCIGFGIALPKNDPTFTSGGGCTTPTGPCTAGRLPPAAGAPLGRRRGG